MREGWSFKNFLKWGWRLWKEEVNKVDIWVKWDKFEIVWKVEKGLRLWRLPWQTKSTTWIGEKQLTEEQERASMSVERLFCLNVVETTEEEI